jgi:hypothetical protein
VKTSDNQSAAVKGALVTKDLQAPGLGYKGNFVASMEMNDLVLARVRGKIESHFRREPASCPDTPR